MKRFNRPSLQGGFTLVEVIVTIMVAGMIAAVLAPFIGPALTKSHEPLENLRSAADLSAEMAKVVAAYRNDPPGDVSSMNDFRDGIADLVDADTAAVAVNQRVMFSEDDEGFVEASCSPADSLDCVLKVRLRGVDNPGETLTYYFPYRK